MAARPMNILPLPDTQSASSVRITVAPWASPLLHAAPCASRTAWMAALSAALSAGGGGGGARPSIAKVNSSKVTSVTRKNTGHLHGSVEWNVGSSSQSFSLRRYPAADDA